MAQNDFTSFAEEVLNSAVQETKKSYEQVLKKIDQDYFVFIKEEGFESLYKRVIDSFYHDYTPTVYDRKESLYHMPQIIITDDYIAIEFDESRMTTFHGGGGTGLYDLMSGHSGLYGLVFKEGWHGGAKSGEGHPDPGTPYWRMGDGYILWGKPAKRAKVAPYDDFVFRLRDFIETEAEAKYRELWHIYTGE